MTEQNDADLQRGDSGDEIASAVTSDSGAVFIPSEPMTPEDQQANLELRETTEGALALVSFTSLEQLVEGCGEQQAWISIPEAEVQQLAAQVGAQVILQDVPLPDQQRKDGHSDVEGPAT